MIWEGNHAYITLIEEKNHRRKVIKRHIGSIGKDKRFYTFRNNFHWFRKYKGYGINAELIDNLHKMGIKTVILTYTNKETKKKSSYYLNVSDAKRYGVKYTAPPKDYPGGTRIYWDTQYIVPKKFWYVIFEKE